MRPRTPNVPPKLLAQAQTDPDSMDVLADWLEEHGENEAATVWRGRATDSRQNNKFYKREYLYRSEKAFKKRYEQLTDAGGHGFPRLESLEVGMRRHAYECFDAGVPLEKCARIFFDIVAKTQGRNRHKTRYRFRKMRAAARKAY